MCFWPQAPADAQPQIDRTSLAWYERVSLGGYAEVHFNQEEGSGKEQLDIHRFVLYLGYDFADWIQLHSETEFEHGYLKETGGENGDGELKLEQLYLDFAYGETWGVRAGRYLQPLGIVNQRHEPETFYGVERSLFDTTVIPTTWFADGVGAYGSIAEDLRWEAYLGSSLDGSAFSATKGIRDGRMQERPGMNQPAVSGRLSWQPSPTWAVGVSGFHGGLNNGDEGTLPDVDANLTIACLDVEGRVGRFEFKGAAASEWIDGAETLAPGVGDRIDGWQLQAAHRVFPDSWRTGVHAAADAAFFVRYDWVDTQAQLTDASEAEDAAKRDEWTFGVSYWPVPSVVVKADYQLRDDESAEGLPERFNMGLGWSF